MNLEQPLSDFLCSYLLEASVETDTRKQYKIACDLVTEWQPTMDCANLFQRESLFAFRNWLASTRAEATVNHKITVVVMLWNYAYDLNLTTSAPPGAWSKGTRKRLRLKQPKRAPDAWTPQQFAAILGAVKHAHAVDGWSHEHWTCLLLTLWESAARIKGLVGDCQAIMPREFWDRPGCSLRDLNGTRLTLPYASDKTYTDQVHAIPPDLTRRLVALTRTDERLLSWPMTLETLRAHYRVILHFAGLSAGRRDLLHKVRRSTATDTARRAGMDAAGAKLGHAPGSAVTRTHYVDEGSL